jgi:hypothetical protein
MALSAVPEWDPTPRLSKNACAPGSWTACWAKTGVTIAVDRITATLRSFKLVIVESLQVIDRCALCAGL